MNDKEILDYFNQMHLRELFTKENAEFFTKDENGNLRFKTIKEYEEWLDDNSPKPDD